MENIKILFFDYNRREQFSKQIASILFFIDLAKQYNYLLVLPRFRFLPNDRKYLSYLDEEQYSYQDFSDFFDFEYLKNFYNNIIEIKDFICIDNIYPLIITTTTKSNELYLLKNNLYQGYFNGYPLKFKKKSDKLDLYKSDLYKLDNYQKILKTEILFFDDVLEQINYNHPDFNSKRTILKYNNHFNDITNNIIKTHFFDNNYLAVHWRRTDFLIARKNSSGIIKNKEYLVKKCTEILNNYQIKFIYLSTDSNDNTEIDFLYQNLPIINIKDSLKNYYNFNDIIIIETLICVNSKIFYGTKTSLFTNNIISLRINNKNNLNYFL
jgi:hypothetical protein